MSPAVERLPRGRHGLSREEVARTQRDRMLLAMVEASARKGYVDTTVADVLHGAKVSRETFYQQFDSKLACFLAAFDAAGELLLAGLAPVVADWADDGATGPVDRVERVERFDRVMGAYLDQIADQSAVTRMFLVEVYAAGPDAIARRAALQARIVEGLVDLLALAPHQRFAAELVVSATSAMVTPLLVGGDTDALRALRTPLVDALDRLLAA